MGRLLCRVAEITQDTAKKCYPKQTNNGWPLVGDPAHRRDGPHERMMWAYEGEEHVRRLEFSQAT